LKVSASKLYTIKAGTVGLSTFISPCFYRFAAALAFLATYPQAKPNFFSVSYPHVSLIPGLTLLGIY
jgi:hypothetical protein